MNAKNRIIFLVTFFWSISVDSYAQKLNDSTELSGQYSVNGKINGINEGWIYLAHTDRLIKGMKIDSVKLKNGEFEFTGSIEGVEAFLIGLPIKDSKGNFVPQSKGFRGLMFLSEGNLFISGDYDSRTKLIASGTAAQNEYNIFRNATQQINDKLNFITGKLYNTKIKNEIEILNNEYKKSSDSLVKAVKNHVIKYPNSITSAYIVKSNLDKADANILKEVYELFTPLVKSSNYGKEVNQLYQKAMFLENGSIAPSFTLSDKDGNSVSLNSFKGNYVLVDFWASWCGPCRQEHPDFLKIYNDYKGKGFEIVSISMDNKKENWLKAINEDKLAWTQLSDLKAKQSEVGIEYGINILPTNFLIDKEGKIIARNLKAINLKNKLDELFLEQID